MRVGKIGYEIFKCAYKLNSSYHKSNSKIELYLLKQIAFHEVILS